LACVDARLFTAALYASTDIPNEACIDGVDVRYPLLVLGEVKNQPVGFWKRRVGVARLTADTKDLVVNPFLQRTWTGFDSTGAMWH
jgi:hypothetical protein